MCRVLQVNRSTYYYEAATKKDESELTADIQEIFRKSRNHYGTRKIKKELADCGKQVSRRRIGRIMKQEGLISSYTTAQFKPQKDRCNESKVANVLNRQFQNLHNRPQMEKAHRITPPSPLRERLRRSPCPVTRRPTSAPWLLSSKKQPKRTTPAAHLSDVLCQAAC